MSTSEQITSQLQEILTRWGFTTVFDIASVLKNTTLIRRRIESGEVNGPRILTVGEPFWGKGGTPIYVRGFLEANHISIPDVESATQAKGRVLEEIHDGADGIKIFANSIESDGILIVEFDHSGNYIRAWGGYGTGPGEFNLPHSVAVDAQGNVYVADRENERIQIFDADGHYLKEWNHIGYRYGLYITPDQNIWMIDGGYDRILELDHNGKVIGALGEPGRGPGQLAWGHFLAVGKDGKIYAAEVLNWRFEVFEPSTPSGKTATYIPSRRMFWDRVESSGWATRTSVPKN